MLIRTRFFILKNIDRKIYADFNIVRPKVITFNNETFDLVKLSNLSHEQNNNIFVGIEQTNYNKDSLYCARNQIKKFKNGHYGYFNFDLRFYIENKKYLDLSKVN